MKKTRFWVWLSAIAMLLFSTKLPAYEIPESAEVTGYFVTGFEDGTPEGWDIGMFYLSNVGYIEYEGSNALFHESMVGDAIVTTHYIEMGDAPRLSFDYQVVTNSYATYGDEDAAKLDSSKVVFFVEISKDAGETWDTVFRVGTGDDADYTHRQDMEDLQAWIPIDIDLAEYAGETCCLRLSVPSMLIFDDVTFAMSWYFYAFDNFAIGTQPEVNMAVAELSGPAFPKVGDSNLYSVKVANEGGAANADWHLTILDENDEEVCGIPSLEIRMAQDTVLHFNYSPASEGAAKLYAMISAADDADSTDNRTAVMSLYAVTAQVEDWQVGEEVMGENGAVAMTEGPLDLYSRSNYTQVIYKAGEFGTNGMRITGLKYAIRFASSQQVSGVQFYIGETEAGDFSDGEWIPFDFLVKVFDGSIYVDAATGLMEVAFDTAYAYKGGNLVVCGVRQGRDFFSGQNFCIDNGEEYAAAHRISKSDNVNNPVTPSTIDSGQVYVNDYIPVTTFVTYANEDNGLIEGKVVDAESNPVAGAAVSVSGTMLRAVTGEDGVFAFDLAPGEYVFSFEAQGYEDKEETLVVKAGEDQEKIFTLELREDYVISGTVKNLDGDPIEGAVVQVLGYENYKGTTDAEGGFIVEGIVEDTSAYRFRVNAPYFKSVETSFLLFADTSVEVSLEDYLDKPYTAEAIEAGDMAIVEWEAPLHEFRYDADGQVVDYTGYEAWINSVIGIAIPYATVLHGVSWFCVDVNVPHETMNIVIVELDETGWPTRNVIARFDGVPNVDNEWNYYEFGRAVEAPNGCLIGLNAGLDRVDVAMTAPTEEYPLEAGRYFACDDINSGVVEGDERVRWADLSLHYPNNLLIRATGEDLGEMDYNDYGTAADAKVSKAAEGHLNTYGTFKGYNVYRFEEGQEESQWTEVGHEVTENMFKDGSFSEVPDGVSVGYAVKAVYANGESGARLTNLITRDVANEGNVLAADELVRIRVVNMSGVVVYDGRPEGFDGKQHTQGVYVVQKTYASGAVKTEKILNFERR